ATEQGGSHMLAVTGDGRRLYTGNTRDNTVSELDLQLERRTNTFAVSARPEAITVTPDGAEVWVGSNAEGTVSVVRPATGEVRTMLEGFGWPYRILITPDQRRALVPDLRRHELRIAERATGR
ncbi:MAG: YncE family protein, partial [Gemmatimonadetes bacterium]|nr:YncE family protein [Gemmatimonadota bacterium]NIT66943.1 YncE family protein [Gemmatimonadota bacterium]NIV22386.1 YncE family protein [Gemmatimonadota bacterium]NIW74133.1 YncE family protein [Gemmatimonadota bacterium]NIY35520.1 YncE family protein [Gemmatimonadota bacterium]